MKKLLNNRLILSLFFLFFLSSSCEDPELDALMDNYCKCISDSRYDEGKRDECFELMDEMKSKYENQPNKIQKIIEKTEHCYN